MRPYHLLAAGLLTLVSTQALDATERDFRALSNAIESRFGVKRESIPMMGFASFIARVSSANSVRGLEMATFEGLRYSDNSAREFSKLVGDILDDNWKPMVRVQSRRSHEWTGIYVRGDSGKLRMMITTLEQGEATVIELNVSPNQILSWMKDPEHAGDCAKDQNCE
jgi:hypothetical protein